MERQVWFHDVKLPMLRSLAETGCIWVQLQYYIKSLLPPGDDSAMNGFNHVANAGSIGVHRASSPAALPSFKVYPSLFLLRINALTFLWQHTIKYSQAKGAYAISAPHLYDGAFERARPSPDHPDSIFCAWGYLSYVIPFIHALTCLCLDDQLSNFCEWKITHITNSMFR